MSKFKVGDKVKFVKSRVNSFGIPDNWTRYVDEDKVYTVDTVSEGGGTITLKEDGYDFVYSPLWLDKVEEGKCEVKVIEGRIKDVKFSGPAIIVFWTDGTKTVVKCRKGDKFDPEKGIAMACAKKLLGNEDGYHKEIAKYTNVENSVKAGPPKDIEKLRRIVSASCFPLNCVTECPCRKLGYCFTISRADRKELLLMYGAFQKAGKLKGVE